MPKKETKEPKSAKPRPIMDNIMGGPGISDVEERLSAKIDKRAVKFELEKEKKNQILSDINSGIELKPNFKDILMFLLAQYLPLMILSAAYIVPGIWYLNRESSAIILLVIGGLIGLYTHIRLICTLTYKIKMTPDQIQWLNVFHWNTVPNKNISEVQAIQSYYFYLTKMGGIVRFGVEVFKIVSNNKEHWVRAYPLRKSKADELVLYIYCWSELTEECSEK
ncbi:MAG: hypothetical protein FK734_04020 [Asgard group archaeon]|nr:hypothetical protein [Asgard group archaeon]